MLNLLLIFRTRSFMKIQLKIIVYQSHFPNIPYGIASSHCITFLVSLEYPLCRLLSNVKWVRSQSSLTSYDLQMTQISKDIFKVYFCMDYLRIPTSRFQFGCSIERNRSTWCYSHVRYTHNVDRYLE